MAALLVGGALLNAALNVLLERLTPGLIQAINFIVGKKLDAKLLRRLKPSLMAAKVVLNDAELKQFNDPDVKDWLDELRDAVYELEDLLDEIVTRATKKEKNEKKVRDSSLADKLEEITDTIEYIVGQKDVLNLDKIKISGTETLSWRPPVTSRVEASEVYGREKEKEDIIELMSNGEGGQLSVIPIVGMGGVGKTTLVNLVYNDEEVKQRFDFNVFVWVCVSEAFDLLKIAQTIIKSIDPDFVCDNMDLNLLQFHLMKKLKEKRFLAVLDDVWSDKYSDWDALKKLLNNGVKGCKILVTTRLERVALMVKTISSFYHLKILSEQDCWSIFAAHACHDSIMDSCLEKVRGDVASKCKGLPLVAKVLGGLFRSSPDFEYWNNILKDVMWDSLDNEIIPALRVSYYYLPPYLKQCFAYCSLFPKNYQFSKTELILMWMAEGFLLPSKGKSTLEEVGYRYFDDLTSRSFFQPKEVHFVLHDLIHELATHVAGDFYFRLGESGDKIGNKTRHLFCNFQNYPCSDNKVFQNLKGIRTFIGLNFSYIPKSKGNDFCDSILSNLPYLRTLSLQDLSVLEIVPKSIGKSIHLRYLNLSGTPIACLPNSICKLYNLQTLKLRRCRSLERIPSDMQDLVNLRYLDLSHSKIVRLPDSSCKLYNLQTLELCGCILESLPIEIQYLVNLRYLDLSSSKIVSLPNSLCKLYNLQTLKLSSCHYLEMLPSDMRDLVELRYLDIIGTCLKGMPRGMGNLKDLQLLMSDFIVSKEQETGIGELGGISHLKGCIEISKLENVKSGDEAYNARMMKKKHIKDLTLSWSDDRDLKDLELERDILANLQPHEDLESLKIKYYRGERFPDWLGSSSYHNMTCLQLFYCGNCCMLPALGQLPALKELGILGLESVESIGDELCPGNSCASIIPFPSLEILEFSSMTSWEQWDSNGMKAFPKLRKLMISDCKNLIKNLPRQLLSLEILKIENCPLLSSSIPMYPKLQNLEIHGSVNTVWKEHELPPSLCELEITGCQMLESMLEALSKHSHLQQLTIRDCSNVSTPMIHLPPSLQHLNIRGCEKVDFVMSSTTPLQNLQSISIQECSHVKRFPEGYSLPTSLTTLELIGFHCLETLNCNGLQHLTSLQQLKIFDCSKLQKLSGEKLHASIKLLIWNCPLHEEKYCDKDKQFLRQISNIKCLNVPPEWRLSSDEKWLSKILQKFRT